ncbi:MAG: hypothetical protein IPK16_14780 [Anaerolineales bacterium]|nr:hypothetical protein [Anaerolineales bacterium]
MSERTSAAPAAQPASSVASGARLAQRRPRLAVNKPGDGFEREADRAAEAVTSGAALPAFSYANQPVIHRDDVGESSAPKEPPRRKATTKS